MNHYYNSRLKNSKFNDSLGKYRVVKKIIKSAGPPIIGMAVLGLIAYALPKAIDRTYEIEDKKIQEFIQEQEEQQKKNIRY